MTYTSTHQRCEFKLRENNHEKVDLVTVQIKNAFKYYGSKKHPVNVLNGLNINVRKNSIYGLLGPSGCGKTTILSCIVGLKQLNSGEVKVFGHKPGSKASGIPGPRIGYMPQELALFKKFTIRETVKYFGLIIGVEDFKAKQESFSKLLKLPNQDSQIETLSFGQQRRVSLMIALFHEPELLILDEPTVGFDPLLREEIWQHLTSLVEGGKTTVIITTHYIQEARLAQTVGMMRDGHLLIEESPQTLVTQHQAETLEGVFINLCNNQHSIRIRQQRREIKLDESVAPEVRSTRPLRALIWKNFLWFSRNLGFMAFIVLFPTLQVLFLFMGYGHDPRLLKFSVVNYELESGTLCENSLTCDSDRLSCNYINRMKKVNFISVNFENDSEAIQQVSRGISNGAVIVEINFSRGLKRRFRDGITKSNLPSAEIDVYLDMSNHVLGQFMKRKLSEIFEDFLKDYLKSCNITDKLTNSPIKFNDPIYGSKNDDLTNFVLPGILLHAVYAVGVALTGGIMLQEKKEGLMNRTFVLGVDYFHVIFAHLITQLTIMVVQIVMVLILVYLFLQMTLNGNLMLIIAILALSGFGGMCLGCFLACSLDNELIANYAIIGIVFPMMCVSDMLWPIEGMPVLMQRVAEALPLTKAVQALRNVNGKGWNLNMVYNGFAITLLWIGIFLILSVIVLKIKKN